MGRYAKTTSVASSKSRVEIEKILARYGAEKFMYGWDGDQAIVAFEMYNRRIKFSLSMPSRDAKEFTHTERGRARKNGLDIEKAYEQSVRQKWRALALIIKAKLEAVDSQITEFEEEFLAHIELPNGMTVGQFMVPQIERAYESKKMPPLLSAPKGG